MNMDKAIIATAGSVVLVGVALGFFVSPWWYLLDVLVGLNLIQASFSGFCPAVLLYRKLGLKPGNAFK